MNCKFILKTFVFLIFQLISTSILATGSNVILVSNYANPSAAAQALSSGDTLWFDSGTYNISQLVIDEDDIHVSGSKGAKLVSNSSSSMFQVTGDNVSISGLFMDLNDSASRGVSATGKDFKFYDNQVINGYYQNLLVAIDYSGAGPAWIQNNYIHDLDSGSDGVIGNSNGAVRAIWLNAANLSDDGTVFIKNNVIDLIKGEEGDAIHIYAYSSQSKARIYIEDNQISNVTRRAVKLQADNVSIIGNAHTNDLSQSELGNAEAVFEAWGNDHVIKNNIIDASLFEDGIKITNANYCEITNNMIKAPESTTSTRAIYLGGSSKSCTIGNNRISNPAYTTIEINNGSLHMVANNIIDAGSISGSYGIKLIGVSNSTVTGNLASSDTNRITYLISLESNSDNNVISNNNAQFLNTQNYAAVRILSGKDSLVSGNRSDSPFEIVVGADKTYNVLQNNINVQ